MSLDVAAVVEEIRAEVERRRRSGAYPQALLARLEASFDPHPVARPLEDLAHIETVRSAASRRPLYGGAVTTLKRAIRRGIAWYVRPIVEDQTRFNFAVVRRLYQLEERLAALESSRVQRTGSGSDDRA